MVIVGSGPIGIRVLRELLRLAPATPIAIYGDEPWEPYNRVDLVGMLTGELNWADLGNLPPLPEHHRVVRHHNNRVREIDRQGRSVVDSFGRRQPYSSLVLATGSHTCIPDIPGVRLPGVYTFRNMSDVYGLLNQPAVGHRVVVLGGGVQGLEVAAGLKKKGSAVWIVQYRRLMDRQLDDRASAMVLNHLCAMDIAVELSRAERILARRDATGEDRVAGVRLFNGKEIPCDCVVLATGIQPTVDLALDSGLRVGRGVKVDDHLRTSDPAIYAVGECAEHRGRVYGLVGPGFEQAVVAARNLLGARVKYRGSVALTQLKGVGLPAFSIGRLAVEPETERSVIHQSADRSRYRKLLLRRGRLAGMVAVGDWPDAWRVREAVVRGRRLWPWQRQRFRATGSLWPEGTTPSVRDWPVTATVCVCVGASRGLLEEAIRQGHVTVASLQRHTNAGTGCGACVPLLAELLGQPVAPKPLEGARGLLIASALGLLFVLVMGLFPAYPMPETVRGAFHPERLWLEGLWKQVSGYTLLTLALIALLMPWRKRGQGLKFASYARWRGVHAMAGTAALLVLMLHTGLALGHNLDRVLVLDFLLLMLLGTLTGGLLVLSARTPKPSVRRWKNFWHWAHILAFWPLPVLLSFHVLSSYYF